MQPDDDLMRLAARGDQDAFDVLSRRHMARLVSFCARTTGDFRLGEEIAQETWLRVWAHRTRYEARGKFTLYLFTLARNRCRNHVRDRERRRAVVSDDVDDEALEVLGTGPHQLRSLVERERTERVQGTLNKLPEPLREALLLRFSDGMSYEDMTALLDVPEPTLRSRVFHGLKRLRSLLGKGEPVS